MKPDGSQGNYQRIDRDAKTGIAKDQKANNQHADYRKSKKPERGAMATVRSEEHRPEQIGRAHV